jgi:hypothetical protein
MDEPFVHRGIIVEYAVDFVGYYLNVVDVLVNVVKKLRTVYICSMKEKNKTKKKKN